MATALTVTLYNPNDTELPLGFLKGHGITMAPLSAIEFTVDEADIVDVDKTPLLAAIVGGETQLERRRNMVALKSVLDSGELVLMASGTEPSGPQDVQLPHGQDV